MERTTTGTTGTTNAVLLMRYLICLQHCAMCWLPWCNLMPTKYNLKEATMHTVDRWIKFGFLTPSMEDCLLVLLYLGIRNVEHQQNPACAALWNKKPIVKNTAIIIRKKAINYSGLY